MKILALALVVTGSFFFLGVTSLHAADVPWCDEVDVRPTFNADTGQWENECMDRVVVTARRDPTFASLVNNSIVPFIDGVLAPFLYAIAFLVFVFGIVRFFFTGGEENREKGKQFAFWGLIGFVVLFSLWGMVRLLLEFVFPT